MQIPGPTGTLEARLDEAQTRATDSPRIAVLCHPHPQYGGSMHDAVLETATGALLAAGIDCVRFNFRGVGASAGVYDHGVGEVDDANAVLAWARDTEPSEIWLAGYSFGARVAWQVLANPATEITVARGLLIAPPVGSMSFDGATTAPVDVFAGDADEFIESAALDAWQGVNIHRIPSANHFFMGAHPQLGDLLGHVIETALRS